MEDKIVRSIKGVVIGHPEDGVLVTFENEEVEIVFPKRLFLSREDHLYGP